MAGNLTGHTRPEPSERPTLNEAIAERVRSLRIGRGWTQEELSSHMRGLGLVGWTRSMVAALETRRRQVSAGDLFSLSLAFGVSIEDLVPERGGPLRLDDGTEVDADTIRGVFVRKRLSRKGAVIQAALDVAKVLGISTEAGEASVESDARGELERKIARRLGVEPQVIARAAISLFGRSATEERDERALASGRPGPGPKRYASRVVREEIEAIVGSRGRA